MAKRLVHRQHLSKEGEALIGDDILTKAHLDKRRVHFQQV